MPTSAHSLTLKTCTMQAPILAKPTMPSSLCMKLRPALLMLKKQKQATMHFSEKVKTKVLTKESAYLMHFSVDLFVKSKNV